MLTPHNTEKLLELIRDFTIIVEGKKDKKALNALGIENVLEISGASVTTFVRKLDKNEKYIILTDYDSEGRKKYKEFCTVLQKLKFKLNLRFRRLIRSSFGVTKIEELIKFSKIKEDDYHGEISTINNKILNRSRFHRKWCSRETRRNRGDIWPD